MYAFRALTQHGISCFRKGGVRNEVNQSLKEGIKKVHVFRGYGGTHEKFKSTTEGLFQLRNQVSKVAEYSEKINIQTNSFPIWSC